MKIKDIRNKPNLKDYFLHLIYLPLYGLVKYFPSPIGEVLRYLFLKIFVRSMGYVRIGEAVTILYPNYLKMGSHVTLNERVFIASYGSITIGNDVRIGHGVSIIASDHHFMDKDQLIRHQGLSAKPIEIASDVYIGANATILGGVCIGKGAVVAAGAVVTKDLEPYSINAGVPAKKINSRKSYSSEIA